jgi:hypothetical protein
VELASATFSVAIVTGPGRVGTVKFAKQIAVTLYNKVHTPLYPSLLHSSKAFFLVFLVVKEGCAMLKLVSETNQTII